MNNGTINKGRVNGDPPLNGCNTLEMRNGNWEVKSIKYEVLTWNCEKSGAKKNNIYSKYPQKLRIR